MSFIDAVFLGIIQGLTEFLPISSSGHLVLSQEILGVNQPGVTFEVLLHLGSLVAVVVYFRARIVMLVRSLFTKSYTEGRLLIGLLLIGTVPAGLAGFLFRDFFERTFSDPIVTAFMLLVTGLILLSTRLAKPAHKKTGLLGAIIMGIGQALAIMPGISRSGTTISAGLLWGIEPSEAAEFSFLLAVPAIGGAMLLNMKELLDVESALVGQYLTGVISSFLFSLVAVYAVLATIRKGRFQYFAYYCFAAGGVGLYIFL